MIDEVGGAQFDGDSYKVTHKGEKFALYPGGTGSTQIQTEQSSLAREERELAEALEQIRMMEQKEQLHIDTGSQVLDYLKQGDLVYELYAVLVHSGSAIGGHYYAYIKSFEDGKWYNFNDSDVREIQAEDITKVFGDKNSNATAYMLKYKQYNPMHKDNPVRIDDTLVPEYLKTEIDTETNKMIEE
jgi:Ubiquitin carboxyl-terminal hydrolase